MQWLAISRRARILIRSTVIVTHRSRTSHLQITLVRYHAVSAQSRKCCLSFPILFFLLSSSQCFRMLHNYCPVEESSVLLNITCLGEILVPLPPFNLLNQITQIAQKGGGCFNIRQTELNNMPFLLALHLWFCMSLNYFSRKKYNSDNFL